MRWLKLVPSGLKFGSLVGFCKLDRTTEGIGPLMTSRKESPSVRVIRSHRVLFRKQHV